MVAVRCTPEAGLAKAKGAKCLQLGEWLMREGYMVHLQLQLAGLPLAACPLARVPAGQSILLILGLD